MDVAIGDVLASGTSQGRPLTTKIHIDTDIGGDIDDLCALAMVLAWPDVEIREANGKKS